MAPMTSKLSSKNNIIGSVVLNIDKYYLGLIPNNIPVVPAVKGRYERGKSVTNGVAPRGSHGFIFPLSLYQAQLCKGEERWNYGSSPPCYLPYTYPIVVAFPSSPGHAYFGLGWVTTIGDYITHDTSSSSSYFT